jgi:hypothetical protein
MYALNGRGIGVVYDNTLKGNGTFQRNEIYLLVWPKNILNVCFETVGVV